MSSVARLARDYDEAPQAADSSIDPGRRRITGVEYTPIVVEEGRPASARQDEVVSLRAGDVLFGPGDTLRGAYRIVKGRVELVLEGPRERELVLASAGPGALVGEDYVLNQAPSLLWAVAATEVIAVVHDRESLLGQICADAALAESLLLSLSKKLETATIRLHNATFMNLECRVAKLLLAGAQETAERGPVTYITHSEIARCTGSCRVAVTRILRQMEKAELVALHRGWIALLDPARLGRMACLADTAAN